MRNNRPALALTTSIAPAKLSIPPASTRNITFRNELSPHMFHRRFLPSLSSLEMSRFPRRLSRCYFLGPGHPFRCHLPCSVAFCAPAKCVAREEGDSPIIPCIYGMLMSSVWTQFDAKPFTRPTVRYATTIPEYRPDLHLPRHESESKNRRHGNDYQPRRRP